MVAAAVELAVVVVLTAVVAAAGVAAAAAVAAGVVQTMRSSRDWTLEQLELPQHLQKHLPGQADAMALRCFDVGVGAGAGAGLQQQQRWPPRFEALLLAAQPKQSDQLAERLQAQMQVQALAAARQIQTPATALPPQRCRCRSQLRQHAPGLAAAALDPAAVAASSGSAVRGLVGRVVPPSPSLAGKRSSARAGRR